MQKLLRWGSHERDHLSKVELIVQMAVLDSIEEIVAFE